MKGLRQLLRDYYSVAPAAFVADRGIPESLAKTHEAEIQGLTSVFAQTQGENWERIVRLLSESGSDLRHGISVRERDRGGFRPTPGVGKA